MLNAYIENFKNNGGNWNVQPYKLTTLYSIVDDFILLLSNELYELQIIQNESRQ